MEQRIPGITKIGYLRTLQLPRDVMLQSMAGIKIGLSAYVTWLPVAGEASLSWNGSISNRAPQEKSTLTFKTHFSIPCDERIAFVVKCASGRHYLIGSREGRRPIVSYTETTGKTNGDPAVRSYTITHIARKSVLECAL